MAARSGKPTGYDSRLDALEVARELEAPLTAIDVERVNAYGLRLGAVAAHGPPYMREGHGVPEEDVEQGTAGGLPSPSVDSY